MTFDPFSIDLPVKEIILETREHLVIDNTLIISAPPGAGKSTLLPLALMEETWLKGQKILMLEPRRLAAKSIAMRMASLMGEVVGQSIGYRIRFEKRVSKATRIEVLTEGIMTRMLQSDNALEGVGLVIFDEIHERSLHADLALALCRESQDFLRPDLRIMLMSATINSTALSDCLNAKAIESKGRQYPVDLIYTDASDVRLLPEITANIVFRAAKEQSGDILVFLPGEGEIRKCEMLLKNQLDGFLIHPLFGMLAGNKQIAAIMPDKQGRRKIVLATAIAETSLTIEGIKTVVDCGFSRVSRFDSKSGLSRLETIEITKDSADQRAGRAGRLGPGVCYRMWSLATHLRLKEQRVPEILEADLSTLVLELAAWGVDNIQDLTWLSPPSAAAVSLAKESLHELEALENNRITEHGRQIQKLPCHPRIAHMLLKAKEENLLPLATDLAALLEERDPLPRETGIDINLRIEALRRHRKGDRTLRPLNRIEKVAATYRQLFRINPDNGPVDPYETGVILVQAYPERIAHASPGTNARFMMANGKQAMASHQDDLAHEPWLAIAHVDDRERGGKIFMASALNPQDLAPLVKENESIIWDTHKGGLVANKELRIGRLVLQSKRLTHPNEEQVVEVISKAIEKEGTSLLNFSPDFTQWQNRVMSLRKWQPDNHWPDVSTDNLLKSNREWLSPYLNRIRKVEDLKKIDLEEVLQNHLPWEKQTELDKLAPKSFFVPSGSKIKLQYQANGDAPVLAVRIQEVFGLLENPTVNQGKRSVLMHLLSPASRPIQITSDLPNFWEDTYFEVRKELRIRYSKHYWPENPLEAEALRGVRRKK
ncbi:ATP-dependent helicase HrpB [Ancylomarina sp. 16SWW S1-10-2]|uniref:ATP-dependent helicase HrpB n=1 Tax=Ancylomarina sp. 16SWW S1-10-2 TaxID=2499681 RepID=UPI0012AD8B24|nr:ATP-dependent helicase HrpB [Ancylomarina sp. 16SWW S1-10-2]MRT93001.1 ATP-dependent helicase HrpB [Ancylomarina sp. 16SWW S1-10-2]